MKRTVQSAVASGSRIRLCRQPSCDTFSDISSIDGISLNGGMLHVDEEIHQGHVQKKLDSIMDAQHPADSRHQCMLSRERGPQHALEWAYIVSPQRLEDSLEKLQTDYQPEVEGSTLLEQLSYVWGFDVHQGKYWNADTPMNITRLLSPWHRSFDNREWLMLPEKDVLQDVAQDMERVIHRGRMGRVRSYDTILPCKLRTFNIVPVKCFTDTYIPSDYRICERQLGPLDGTLASSPPSYLDVDLPFADFVVESHIHPYIAICDAVLKLPVAADLYRVPVECFTLISVVRHIWCMWMTVKVPRFSTPPPRASPVVLPLAPPTLLPVLPAEKPRVLAKRKAVDDGNTTHPKRTTTEHRQSSNDYIVASIPVARPSGFPAANVPSLPDHDSSNSAASPTPSHPSSSMDVDEPLDTHQSTDDPMLGIEESVETTSEKSQRGIGKARAWIRCWPRKLSRLRFFAKTNPCIRPVPP